MAARSRPPASAQPSPNHPLAPRLKAQERSAAIDGACGVTTLRRPGLNLPAGLAAIRIPVTRSAVGSRSRARSLRVRPDQGQQRLSTYLGDGTCPAFEQSDVRRRLVWTKIGRFEARTHVPGKQPTSGTCAWRRLARLAATTRSASVTSSSSGSPGGKGYQAGRAGPPWPCWRRFLQPACVSGPAARQAGVTICDAMLRDCRPALMSTPSRFPR